MAAASSPPPVPTRPRIESRVAALSRVELRDMAAYYTVIAAGAAQLAADRATPEDVEHLQRVVKATDLSDEAACRRGEGTFRLEVAALSQSARLVREELRLQSEFAPLLWLCLRDAEYRRASRDGHTAVVDAIAAMDGGAARRATEEHLGAATEWLLEAKAELEATDDHRQHIRRRRLRGRGRGDLRLDVPPDRGVARPPRSAVRLRRTAVLSSADVDGLVEEMVTPQLGRDGALIIGAGYVAAPGFLTDTGVAPGLVARPVEHVRPGQRRPVGAPARGDRGPGR